MTKHIFSKSAAAVMVGLFFQTGVVNATDGNDDVLKSIGGDSPPLASNWDQHQGAQGPIRTDMTIAGYTADGNDVVQKAIGGDSPPLASNWFQHQSAQGPQGPRRTDMMDDTANLGLSPAEHAYGWPDNFDN